MLIELDERARWPASWRPVQSGKEVTGLEFANWACQSSAGSQVRGRELARDERANDRENS